MARSMVAVFTLCVALGVNLGSQVLQPQPPPDTSAANAPWYLAGEPLPIFGAFYRPTGPTVYFNRNQMVPAATFGGVTIYMDTTIEPYSVVFVPIGGGLMRPYERRRSGELAGTVGSRPPSFPVEPRTDATAAVNPLLSPSDALPQLPASVPFMTDRPREAPAEIAEPRPVGTTGVRTIISPGVPTRDETIRWAASDRIWIEYSGKRFRAAGKAVEYSDKDFVRRGEYRGFTVYGERDAKTATARERIYLPVAGGKVTPYEPIGK
jgi:hypothetical protein